MGTYRVRSAGYVQVIPPADNQPARTQIRHHGEVFELADKTASAAPQGHLEAVVGNAEGLTPLPALTSLPLDSPVRLATGEHTPMTAAMFRVGQEAAAASMTVEQASALAAAGSSPLDADPVGSAEPNAGGEKPHGNASVGAWRAYAVAQGWAPAEVGDLPRDEIRALFD
jgi:hypothetical protein